MIDAKQEIIDRLIKKLQNNSFNISERNINEIIELLSKNQFVVNNNKVRKDLTEIIEDISNIIVRKETKERFNDNSLDWIQ